MTSQEASRNASDGKPPIRRTRSANDLDTLAYTAIPVALVSDQGTELLNSRPVGMSTSSRSSQMPRSSGDVQLLEPIPTIHVAATGGVGAPLPLDGAPQLENAHTALQGGPIRHFFSSIGIGRGASQAKKDQLSLVWNLFWGLTQVVTIVILVSLTGTIWKNPKNPEQTEWDACDRPLGVWAILWAVRVVIASGMSYWEYRRSVSRAAIRAANPISVNTAGPSSSPAPAVIPQPHAQGEPGFITTNNQNNNEPPIVLPYSLLYSRLTLFASLMTLTWFLTAHILQYTSLHTCRYTSPHLWWLTFGILCIMYLMVLEVILLGFIVLIVAPILFVFWNIFLFCIGRHPAQNPQMIKPDIGKLSKSIVDRIPLVMYIPPPPVAEEANANSPVLNPAHEYPPTSPTAPPHPQKPDVPKRSRFRFFKRKPRKEGNSTGKSIGDLADVDLEKGKAEQETWESSFERGDYPLVVLEGNRAACAICLMDFEAPKRRGEEEDPSENPSGSSSPVLLPAQTPPIIAEQSSDATLKLADSGEGAQPLRLLACGHVFHQTCLDPWLTDVSGRCPVCQRPVEVNDLKKKQRQR